jgi:hypothetical protein
MPPPDSPLEDPSLPHQIVLRASKSRMLTVSCNCLAGTQQVIASRGCQQPGEGREEYRRWHAGQARSVL